MTISISTKQKNLKNIKTKKIQCGRENKFVKETTKENRI